MAPIVVDDGDRIFTASIHRISNGGRIMLCLQDGRREVCGCSETWALRNAQALIDRGALHEAAVAV